MFWTIFWACFLAGYSFCSLVVLAGAVVSILDEDELEKDPLNVIIIGTAIVTIFSPITVGAKLMNRG